MPKNILVDLNVILDVLLERRGHQASQIILELQQTTSHIIFISGHMVTTLAYLLEHAKVPQAEIRRQIDWLLQTFSVIPTSDEILKQAIESQITDYEDAVIEQAALACKASLIVTRNIKDFKQSVVSATTPESFVM
jgi:predicted nucleic acid-binding protein